MIGRYIKKPVNIEAIQYAGDDNQEEIVKWGNGNIYPVNVGYGSSLHCKTLEGELTISVGDWIIKGIKGEYYPCRDDIFRLTYSCQHINKVPATDPKFDWKCQDCKEKFNEIPNKDPIAVDKDNIFSVRIKADLVALATSTLHKGKLDLEELELCLASICNWEREETKARQAKFLEELPEFLHIKMEEINNNDDITTPFCVALANAITEYLNGDRK